MHIGILQTGHAADPVREAHGDYRNMFERLLAGRGLTFSSWDVVDMDFPASVHDAEGWLITGSKHGAYEGHPWIPPLESFIRDAYAAPVPMVGICFGHQIIAQALGGKVEKFEGGWAVGHSEYDWQGERVVLNAFHQDQVTELPKDAEVIASSTFCEYAALVYDKRAFTVQAHPEFDRGVMEGLLVHRGPGLLPEEMMARARERLDAPLDDRRLAGEIARFFEEART